MKRMLKLVVTFAVLTGITVAAPQQNNTSSIEGLVLRAGTNDPIAGAQVVLARVPPSGLASGPGLPSLDAAPPSVTTDAAGKFIFKDVAPATYRLSVTRDGFVLQEYGSRRIGQQGTGTVLNPTSGHPIKDVVVVLTATGSINGRVFGPMGEPLSGMEVQVLRAAYDSSGARNFRVIGTAQTDDRGAYRLYWITPGRYYISAGPSTHFANLPPAISASSSKTYITTFYPNSPDPDAAVVVELSAAADVNGMDISTRQLQTYRIRGRVVDAATGGLTRGQVTFSITPRRPISSMSSAASVAAYKSDGSFELRDIAPGQYWIRVQSSAPASAASPPSKPEIALVAVDVGGADVEDVVIVLQPETTISGRITVDPPAATPQTFRPTIRVIPPSTGSVTIPSPAGTPVNADGVFTQENVFPAEYRVVVSGLPPTFYIKEERLGGLDVLGKPFTVAGSVSDVLNIVVSPNAGEVSGIVQDDRHQPVAAALVALIPDRLRERVDLFKPAMTDASGRFTIRGITPGDYKLFTWTDLDPGSYFEPSVLQSAEPVSKPVHILESSKETVNLTVIRGRSQ